MYSPWADLSSLPGWAVRYVDLPGAEFGRTHWGNHTILLDRRLSQVQRRCTLAHELCHVERGPVLDDPVLVAREEQAVTQLAARRLIALDDLASGLRWTRDRGELAHELWVTRKALRIRMDHLHPSELAWLANHLGDR